MALTLTELQQQLVEAQTALHELQIGKAVRVFVDQNGERVEYNVAKIPALELYISKLNKAIAEINGTRGLSGPLRILF